MKCPKCGEKMKKYIKVYRCKGCAYSIMKTKKGKRVYSA